MNEAAEKVIELSQESFSRAEDRALPAIVEPGQATPMSMLAMAVKQGMSLETIKELRALQKEYEADEARKAYAAALAAFKSRPLVVVKDKENTQYSKGGRKAMYTSKGNLVNTINPVLSEYGLSAGWTFDQTKGISVTCKLTHKMGHSESVTLGGLPDDSGAKNPLQQIKSAITYLEVATFEAVTGTASTEGGMDDDGNGSGGKEKVEPDAEGKKALEACGSMASLADAWKALTKEQRLTLVGVKSECKDRILEADRAAA